MKYNSQVTSPVDGSQSKRNEKIAFQNANVMNNQSAISEKTRNRIMRDKEFLEIYDQVFDLMLKHKVPHPRQAAISFALLSGRPHYYVGLKRAYKVVGDILKHDKVPTASTEKQAMWLEIAEQVKQLRKSGKIPLMPAVAFVLDHCRASRFHMNQSYAALATYRAIYERKKRRLAKLSLHASHIGQNTLSQKS